VEKPQVQDAVYLNESLSIEDVEKLGFFLHTGHPTSVP